MPQIPFPSTLVFWLETIVPGIVGGAVAYPLLPQWARLEAGTPGIAGFLATTLFIGLIVHLLRTPLVEFAMGRYWFIPRARGWLTARIQRAADKALGEVQVEAQQTSSGSEVVQRTIWSRRFLEALVAGPGGRRLAYCPTLIGNAYFALVLDLYQIAELTERLQGNPAAAWAAQTAITRAWYGLSKDMRTELAEAQAVAVALLRITVIAGMSAIVYFVRALVPGGELLSDLSRAVAAIAVAGLAYVAGLEEMLGFLGTARALFMTLDRDTVQAWKTRLETQIQPSVTEQAKPSSIPSHKPGPRRVKRNR